MCTQELEVKWQNYWLTVAELRKAHHRSFNILIVVKYQCWMAEVHSLSHLYYIAWRHNWVSQNPKRSANEVPYIAKLRVRFQQSVAQWMGTKKLEFLVVRYIIHYRSVAIILDKFSMASERKISSTPNYPMLEINYNRFRRSGAFGDIWTGSAILSTFLNCELDHTFSSVQWASLNWTMVRFSIGSELDGGNTCWTSILSIIRLDYNTVNSS